MPKRSFLLPTGAALMLFFWTVSVRAEWVEWLGDGKLSVQANDNINNSFFSAQTESDYVWSGALSGGRVYQLGSYTRAYLNAVFTGDLHHRFANLDQYTLGATALLTHKFGLGWAAPVLSLSTSVAPVFSSSTLRSGNKMQSSLRLSQWFHHDILQGQLAYRFDHRDGSGSASRKHPELAAIPGSVFDIQGHTVEALVNITASEQLHFTFSYGWRWGDITANSTLNSVSSSFLSHVHALNEDDALPGWIYRLYGTTQTYDTGLSYSFLGRHALSTLAYRHIDSQAWGLEYTINQVWLGVNYSY